MDRLKTIGTFIATAQAGSFSSAARNLRLSRALVSRQIADLEAHLGVRLFSRTTRMVSLTSAGQQYLDACTQFVQDLHETEAELANLQSELRGMLKIISVRSFGERHLAAALADFSRLHPQLRLEMELAPGIRKSLQLESNGFDIGIGVAEARGAANVPRVITQFDWILCGAPSYVARNGAPASLEDLPNHVCMVNQRHTPGGVWTLYKNNRRERVRIDARFAITSYLSLRETMLTGAGIAILPSYCVMDDLKSGNVVQFLDGYKFERSVIRAYYPHFNSVPHKARLFADFLKKRFTGKFSV